MSDKFFRGLPDHELTPVEQALREVLLRAINSFPAGPFPLTEWIDRRIGGEVETRRTKGGAVEIMMRSGPPPSTSAPKEAFLDTLPANSFTPAEEALREAIIDFLATWRSPELATVQELSSGQEVVRRTKALLPRGLTLKDWIQHRIGGELELRPDGRRGEVIHLSDSMRAIVMTKFHALHHGPMVPGHPMAGPPPMHMPPHLGRGPPPPDGHMGPPGMHGPPMQAGAVSQGSKEANQRASEEQKEEFFASLPADEFTPEEENLRDALLGFLDNWKGKGAPTLSDAGPDEQVSKSRKLLLPKGCPVSMKEWIDRRIGGEIETRLEPNGQCAFGPRGQLAPPEKRRRAN